METLEKAGLAVNYNKILSTKPNGLPKKVHIWDETLRDGEQTPGVALTIDEKIEIAKMLDEIGTAIVAVGFPAVSEAEKKAVATIACEGLSRAIVAAPARAIRADIDACIEADVKEVPIFIATSDFRLKYQLRMSREQMLERLTECVEYGRDHGLVIDYIAEDSTRSDMDFLCQAYKTAIDAGASKICIADTVGFVRPEVMKYIVREVKERLWSSNKYKTPLAVHCHDDFGLATANTLAAIEEGVTYPQVCVNAYGERAGNAAFEEVVMALDQLYNIETGIETEKIYALAKLVERHFVVPLPLHKAITGDNAFTHSSGIHSHGQLTHSMTYEPISPMLVGRKRTFHLGKFVGRHFVEYMLKMGGVRATPEQAKEIAERVKRTHEAIKKQQSKESFDRIKDEMKSLQTGVSERDFWAIVFDVI
ncbi:MAG: homocitrate synthase/isopropylmalate synthase family protein [Candidatus Thorarchaeota archaeon]|nr:MAG: homoaconitate hydratase [Candidatus Thorarchaeota archaeon]